MITATDCPDMKQVTVFSVRVDKPYDSADGGKERKC